MEFGIKVMSQGPCCYLLRGTSRNMELPGTSFCKNVPRPQHWSMKQFRNFIIKICGLKRQWRHSIGIGVPKHIPLRLSRVLRKKRVLQRFLLAAFKQYEQAGYLQSRWEKKTWNIRWSKERWRGFMVCMCNKAFCTCVTKAYIDM